MKYYFMIVTAVICCSLASYAQNYVPDSTAASSHLGVAALFPGAPATLPKVLYHLTARPWKPLNIPSNAYLDRVEAIVRAIATFQNATGAIIDPYAGREIQYATPYFANAVGTLLSAGRATDLLNAGVAAMNSATADVAAGAEAIPDNHGEFFIAPLASAVKLYTPFVSATQVQTWKNRMAKPVEDVIRGLTHNWRTYAMKGEWYRAKQGYVNKANAVGWVENSWANTQKSRFTNNFWNFYQDQFSDPLPWAYESVARSNLLAMLADGYDGASKNEMLTLLKKGTQSSLLVQDPSGQEPAGGRSGNHTWNDILMANAYEIMAEIVYKEGNTRLAGQYRRAAALGHQSAQRWKRSDGTYSVTKNHYSPASRVRYATYSHFTNYNGNMMYHMAESYLRHQTNIAELPAPNEIGGYTLISNTPLATAVANAGGMQMVVGLRGSTQVQYNNYWSTLGIVRFSRTEWDSRLGPSDGIRETASKLGVSFAPTFFENGTWVRLASMPDRYEAFFTTQFTHPLLVRCQVEYKPKTGKTGPVFTNNLVITPDGILSTLTSTTGNFGITWPILTYDGTTSLVTAYTSHTASTNFPGQTDQENFIALHSSPIITTTEATRRSSYGDLRPVRMVSGSASNTTFIYPRSAADPTADMVRKSFTGSASDFSTLLGKVKGSIYIGRTSAGGVGTGIDIDGDSSNEATFSISTGFMMQLTTGAITNIESDRDVTAVIYGQTLNLKAYTPVSIVNPYKFNVINVIASADDGNVATNTIDQNYATRWAAKGDGQWIRYYLSTTTTLKTVKLSWYRGDERQARFDVQTSLDSVQWKTVYSGLSTGKTTLFETYNVIQSLARYVRILCHGNNLNLWNAITEAAFFSDVNLLKGTQSIFISEAAPKQTDHAQAPVTEQDLSVKVVPNPVQGKCYVTVPTQWLDAELLIYDVSGRIIMKQTIQCSTVQLDLSSYAKGTYLLTLLKKRRIFRGKLINQ